MSHVKPSVTKDKNETKCLCTCDAEKRLRIYNKNWYQKQTSHHSNQIPSCHIVLFFFSLSLSETHTLCLRDPSFCYGFPRWIWLACTFLHLFPLFVIPTDFVFVFVIGVISSLFSPSLPLLHYDNKCCVCFVCCGPLHWIVCGPVGFMSIALWFQIWIWLCYSCRWIAISNVISVLCFVLWNLWVNLVICRLYDCDNW